MARQAKRPLPAPLGLEAPLTGVLLASGERPHFIGYYALVMGLHGRPWTDCRGAEKDALRRRFDALMAETRPDPMTDFERTLDDLGVRAPR